MNKGLILVIAAGFIVIAGISSSCISDGKAEGEEPISSAKIAQKIINVDELAENPEAFQGDIVLHGVVAGVNKSKGVFGVIDAREFKSCGVLSCARFTLPVKYTKRAPELKSFVNISGRLTKDEKGMLVVARKVEVIK